MKKYDVTSQIIQLYDTKKVIEGSRIDDII